MAPPRPPARPCAAPPSLRAPPSVAIGTETVGSLCPAGTSRRWVGGRRPRGSWSILPPPPRDAASARPPPSASPLPSPSLPRSLRPAYLTPRPRGATLPTGPLSLLRFGDPRTPSLRGHLPRDRDSRLLLPLPTLLPRNPLPYLSPPRRSPESPPRISPQGSDTIGVSELRRGPVSSTTQDLPDWSLFDPKHPPLLSPDLFSLFTSPFLSPVRFPKQDSPG